MSLERPPHRAQAHLERLRRVDPNAPRIDLLPAHLGSPLGAPAEAGSFAGEVLAGGNLKRNGPHLGSATFRKWMLVRTGSNVGPNRSNEYFYRSNEYFG